MEGRQRRRRLYAVVAAGVVGAYILTQLAIAAALAGGPSPKDLQRPLPLPQTYKTGGTSVASALARVARNDDAAYGAWTGGGSSFPLQNWESSAGIMMVTGRRRSTASWGDGHGCAAACHDRTLVTLLGTPLRFVSRLYLSAAPPHFQRPPFHERVGWTRWPRMERTPARVLNKWRSLPVEGRDL